MLSEFPLLQPIWGWYDGSQEIMEQQIDLMADHGIDFIAFDWYWATDNSTINTTVINNNKAHKSLEYYLTASNKSRVKFCLMVANHTGSRITGTANWTAAAEFWLPYLQDSQYYTVDGKPLIIVYDPSGSTAEALAAADAVAVTGGLAGISFAGSGSAIAVTVANGYPYRTYYNTVLGYSEDEEEKPYSDLATDNKTYWAGTAEQPMILPIMAGWDRRPWKAITVPPPDGWYFTRATNTEFKALLADAVTYMDNNATKVTAERTALIFAWNEIGEGGYLMPNEGDPEGNLLNAIAGTTTYYVASTGSNTSPYDTLAKAATQVETVIENIDLGADDTIKLYTDITEADAINWPTGDSGTGATDLVTLDLNGYTITTSAANGIVFGADVDYVHVTNGTIKLGGAAGTNYCVYNYSDGVDHITFSGVTFDTSAADYGIGFYFLMDGDGENATDILIDSCYFLDNDDDYGFQAIGLASVTIQNCKFINTNYGIVDTLSAFGSPTIVCSNNTFYSCATVGIVVILNTDPTQLTITNCIFSTNATGISDLSGGATDPTNTYNLYYGSTTADVANLTKGAGSITGYDPLFTDATGLDFTLTALSPCINQGTTIEAVTTDYAGVARPQGDAYDIGAYERVAVGNLFSTNPKFRKSYGEKNSDFYLSPGSPCIDTGVSVVGLEKDALGNPRPRGAGWDMGAIESMPGDVIHPLIDDGLSNLPGMDV